jgi:hypothetical protein
MVMTKMLSWLIEKPLEHQDNLPSSALSYISHITTDELATAEWRKEYTNMIEKHNAVVKLATTNMTIHKAGHEVFPDASKYTCHELMDYLWDNRGMFLDHKDTHIIPKTAIRFICDTYIRHYNDTITQMMFIGYGAFREAWYYTTTRFYETASRRHFLKWIEYMVRLFADTMYSSDTDESFNQNPEEDTTQAFSRELIKAICDKRDEIAFADSTVDTKLYELLYELVVPIFIRHYSTEVEPRARYLMIANALSHHQM